MRSRAWLASRESTVELIRCDTSPFGNISATQDGYHDITAADVTFIAETAVEVATSDV